MTSVFFGIRLLLQKRIEPHKLRTVLHQFKMDGKMGSGEEEFSMNCKWLCWLSHWRQLIPNSNLLCCLNDLYLFFYANQKTQRKLTHLKQWTQCNLLYTWKQICAKVKQETLAVVILFFFFSLPPSPTFSSSSFPRVSICIVSVENYCFYSEQSLSQMNPSE